MVRMSYAKVAIVRSVLLLSLAMAGLFAAKYWGGYLLFHVLTELFGVTVLSSVFVVTWNTRQRASNGYLSLLGLGCLFLGAMTLIHTLAYSGMNVIPGVSGAGRATQVWIAMGIVKAATLVVAPLFINRKINWGGVTCGYALVTALLLLSIFKWSIFPVCFVEGSGLTPFKIYAEYVICAMLLLAGVGWWIIRRSFSDYVRHMLMAGLAATILAEILFTFYISATGPSNMAGHLFVLLSYYLLYKAIVQTALTDPFDLLLSDLRANEQQLRLRVGELDAAREVAQRANDAKGRFLAVLSHELRTPLTPVLASVSGLLVDDSAPATLRPTLQMIQRNIELQARLVDDLLDLARLDNGKMRLDRVPIDVQHFIRHAADTCRPGFEDKGVVLELLLEAQSSWTNGDSARIEQIVWNLLSNGRKFTPRGGKVTVRSFNEVQGEELLLVIEVKDTGAGIGVDAQKRLFTPFEQLSEQSAKAGGLGLGLVITRDLVRLHGGSIKAHSAGAGRGSVFTVKLPTIKHHLVKSDTGNAEASLATTTRRILLVEDHADTARVIGQLLRRDGHIVEIAGDMASARRFFSTVGCELVISDIGLPDGSGLDLLKIFRSERPEVPAICMSGYGAEEDLRGSSEAGTVCHLVKPITLQRLRQALREAFAPDAPNALK